MILFTLFLQILVFLIVLTVIYVAFAAIFFKSEIKSALERDPAAVCALEILLAYSGFHAIIIHKTAHALYKTGIPLIPRLISQAGRHLTGVEIHPGAVIGKGLFIDHGMGVVIGETVIIGDNVTLFQGVTLGGTGEQKGKRHPTLGNNVVVGTGAKILGGINIGDNVNVGANAVVIRDIPPNSTVVGVPGRVAKKEGKKIPGINLDHTSLPDPLANSLKRLQCEIDKIEAEIKEWHKGK
ncbi:MAG: serine O-acetyltransferase EpsC [Candidatus Omnitrophota bacterium]|nr:serine O-acetyltransferase EpsC [Candidatus Omnitrophota bacterium]